MLLTRKKLKEILQSLRVSIPSEMEKELLAQYENLAIDDEGHLHDYTEQDLYQHIRKKTLSTTKSEKEVTILN